MKKQKKNAKNKNRDEKDYTKTITHCPTCGVDLSGPNFCKSINCACAPRITC